MISNPLKKLFVGLIKFYQLFISPFKVPSCRFLPTCSEYCKDAFNEHGFFYAIQLSIIRLCKCHVFSKQQVDIVPKVKNKKGKHEI